MREHWGTAFNNHTLQCCNSISAAPLDQGAFFFLNAVLFLL